MRKVAGAVKHSQWFALINFQSLPLAEQRQLLLARRQELLEQRARLERQQQEVADAQARLERQQQEVADAQARIDHP